MNRPTSTKNVEPEMAARGKARRKALGLSLTELAARMATTTNRIVVIERDGITTLRGVRAWARALELHPVELAFGDRPKCAACATLERTEFARNYDVWSDRALGAE